MPLQIDITYLTGRKRRYIQKLIERGRIRREITITFPDDGESAWRCIRVLRTLRDRSQNSPVLWHMPERMLVTAPLEGKTWNPMVWKLATKQKLSQTNRRKLQQIKSSLIHR